MHTQAQIKELVSYNPESGEFVLLKSDSPRLRNKVGKAIDPKLSRDGYKFIMLEGKTYSLHKLAVLYMTGTYPSRNVRVDHEDRNPTNNRWSNLRVVLPGGNVRNQKQTSDKLESGYTGIYTKRTQTGKLRYKAAIRVDGKLHHLGTFNSLESALEARQQAHNLEMSKLGNFKTEEECLTALNSSPPVQFEKRSEKITESMKSQVRDEQVKVFKLVGEIRL